MERRRRLHHRRHAELNGRDYVVLGLIDLEAAGRLSPHPTPLTELEPHVTSFREEDEEDEDTLGDALVTTFDVLDRAFRHDALDAGIDE